MATLNENSNRVLSEFGGRIPAHLLSFEDARREFLQVRALELQKLGIADTDKTVQSARLMPSSRNGAVPSSFGDITPAFVEYSPTNTTNVFEKVEIVPVEKIPEYSGGRAIAFYGSPLRYRTSFDFWTSGAITIWYDGVEDLFSVSGGDELAFAGAFSTYLVKKAAFNLCGTMLLNLAFSAAPEEDERMKIIVGVLKDFQSTLAIQVAEWQKEFRKFTNAPLNTQANLRRTNDEIAARNYNNVTRSSPLDYVG